MNYSENEFESVYNEIINRLCKNKTPENKPQAYILGGQPGAGKTALQEMIVRNNKNTIVINADSYRVSHPRFKEIQAMYGDDSPTYTQPFINQVVERLINDLSDKKYNLIIEGTLRTSDVPINTCKKFKNKGYKVELDVISVKKEISYESTILRYEKKCSLGSIPRATAKLHHDKVVDAICDNLDEIYKQRIFDNINLYDREGNNIYNINKGVSPASVEKEKLFGNWNDYEIGSYTQIIEEIISLKKSRNSPDLTQYIIESSKRLNYAKSHYNKLIKQPITRNQIVHNARIISKTKEKSQQHNKNKER